MKTLLQIKRGKTWHFVTALSEEDASISLYPCRALTAEEVKPSNTKALYAKMKLSGMFWELYPDMSGDWTQDEEKLFRWVNVNWSRRWQNLSKYIQTMMDGLTGNSPRWLAIDWAAAHVISSTIWSFLSWGPRKCRAEALKQRGSMTTPCESCFARR